MNLIHRVILIVLAVLGIGAWMALAAHEAGANTTPASTTEPECKSTRAARKACAARDVCQSIYGPDAVHFWTHDGDLVCRRAKPLT